MQIRRTKKLNKSDKNWKLRKKIQKQASVENNIYHDDLHSALETILYTKTFDC